MIQIPDVFSGQEWVKTRSENCWQGALTLRKRRLLRKITDLLPVADNETWKRKKNGTSVIFRQRPWRVTPLMKISPYSYKIMQRKGNCLKQLLSQEACLRPCHLYEKKKIGTVLQSYNIHTRLESFLLLSRGVGIRSPVKLWTFQ